eukprot:2638343-Alexandrium_andersonii.AAC.1
MVIPHAESVHVACALGRRWRCHCRMYAGAPPSAVFHVEQFFVLKQPRRPLPEVQANKGPGPAGARVVANPRL